MKKTLVKVIATALVPMTFLEPLAASNVYSLNSARTAFPLNAFSSQRAFEPQALNVASDFIRQPVLLARNQSASICESLTRTSSSIVFRWHNGHIAVWGAVLVVGLLAVARGGTGGLTAILSTVGWACSTILIGTIQWPWQKTPEQRKMYELFKLDNKIAPWRDRLWLQVSHRQMYENVFSGVFKKYPEQKGIAADTTNRNPPDDYADHTFLRDSFVPTSTYPSLQKTAYGLVGQLWYALSLQMKPAEAEKISQKILAELYQGPGTGLRSVVPYEKDTELGEPYLGYIVVFNHVDPYKLKPIVAGIQAGSLKFSPSMRQAELSREVVRGLELHQQHMDVVRKGFTLRPETPGQRRTRLRNYLVMLAEHPALPYTIDVNKIDEFINEHPEWLTLSVDSDHVAIVNPYSWDYHTQSVDTIGKLPRDVAATLYVPQLSWNVFVRSRENPLHPLDSEYAFYVRADHKWHPGEFTIAGGMKVDEEMPALDRLLLRMSRQFRFPEGHRFSKERLELIRSVNAPLFDAQPQGRDVQFRITYRVTLDENEQVQFSRGSILGIAKERHEFPSEAAYQDYLRSMYRESGKSRWDAVDIFTLPARELLNLVDRAYNKGRHKAVGPSTLVRNWIFHDPKKGDVAVEKHPEVNHDLLVTILGPGKSPIRVKLSVSDEYRQKWLKDEMARRDQIEDYVRKSDEKGIAKAAYMQSRFEPLHNRYGSVVKIYAAAVEEWDNWVVGKGFNHWLRLHRGRLHISDGWINKPNKAYSAAFRNIIHGGLLIHRWVAPLRIGRYGRFIIGFWLHLWFSFTNQRLLPRPQSRPWVLASA